MPAVFIRRSREAYSKAKSWQIAMAVFQIVLCGWFFALCVSDFLDIEVNFSLERLVLDIFYIIAFLAIYIYVLFFDRKRNPAHLKAVDIPLNFAALFMRPALFASLALAYREWLEGFEYAAAD